MRHRFGTVLATRAGAHVRIKGASQRSGKTYDTVAKSPDGTTCFVSNIGMQKHIEACLTAQGRNKTALNIVLKEYR